MLLNSRLGRTVEEVVVDEIVQGWRRFGLRLITGLFWFIVDLFRAIRANRRAADVHRGRMASVPERRKPRASLVAKAVLGLLWFFVAYVLRFAVNVLLEPQINPIKHFPVVTVGHKLLLRHLQTGCRFAGEASLGIGKIGASPSRRPLSGASPASSASWCGN